VVAAVIGARGLRIDDRCPPHRGPGQRLPVTANLEPPHHPVIRMRFELSRKSLVVHAAHSIAFNVSWSNTSTRVVL
jgi:hypothetical protein